MSISSNIADIRRKLPSDVKLVAVSKFHPEEAIMEAYDAGQRAFGESRPQELCRKQAALPSDIEWHFIGHLQTNKVKLIVPFVHIIESVDSWHLLQEINRQALRCGRVVDVLLEVHVAQETTKSGFTVSECKELFDKEEWKALANVNICGIMTMASFTDDHEQVRAEMMQAYNLFSEVRTKHFPDSPSFTQRSWGMSNDWPVAVECHSSIVRIGTAIFGDR